MGEFGFQKDMSPKDPLLDVAIGIALIVGTWATNHLAAYLFPDGLPLQLHLLLLGRDLGTLSWVFAMTARYFSFAYYDLNSTINRIARSRTWNRSIDAIARGANWLYNTWQKFDQPARYLAILIVILLVSFITCLHTYNLIYLMVPPIYWGGTFYLAHRKELKSKGAWKATEKYWLSALLIFLIIIITVNIAIIGSSLLGNHTSTVSSLGNEAREYSITLVIGTLLYILISLALRRPRHQWRKGKSFSGSTTFLIAAAA